MLSLTPPPLPCLLSFCFSAGPGSRSARPGSCFEQAPNMWLQGRHVLCRASLAPDLSCTFLPKAFYHHHRTVTPTLHSSLQGLLDCHILFLAFPAFSLPCGLEAVAPVACRQGKAPGTRLYLYLYLYSLALHRQKQQQRTTCKPACITQINLLFNPLTRSTVTPNKAVVECIKQRQHGTHPDPH
jgi:hypothetical protein